MQRSKTSQSTSTTQSASTALRRTLRSSPALSDDDDIADPRPWETRSPLKSYGSSSHSSHPSHPSTHSPASHTANLPLYDSMETRRRYGEKESVEGLVGEKIGLMEDDQGKWAKGHGAGPGIGGRRGLPPRQRPQGWVSLRSGMR